MRSTVALALCLLSSAASAASCPSTCMTFEDAADAERFVTLIITATAADVREFMARAQADHKMQLLPAGTQFILLTEHRVAAAKSSYYAIQLPGALATKYLVSVK